jgi:hypothetical protein
MLPKSQLKIQRKGAEMQRRKEGQVKAKLNIFGLNISLSNT